MRWRWYRTPVLRECGFLLQWAPLRLWAGLLHRLPPAAARRLVLAKAEALHRLALPWRRRAQRNLALALGELPAAARERVVRRCFRHFALLACDSCWLRAGHSALAERVRFSPEDAARLSELAADRRGALLLSGHLGCPEVAAAAVASLGIPVTVVARRHRNPWIRRALEDLRSRLGLEVLHADGDSMRALLAVLRSGGFLALTPDKRLRRASVPVRFFGQTVRVPAGPALLSLRSGAPIVVGGALREGETDRFRIRLERVLAPREHGRAVAAVHRLSQEWTEALETLIRAHPEQWIWFHNRWRLGRSHRTAARVTAR